MSKPTPPRIDVFHKGDCVGYLERATIPTVPDTVEYLMYRATYKHSDAGFILLPTVAKGPNAMREAVDTLVYAWVRLQQFEREQKYQRQVEDYRGLEG